MFQFQLIFQVVVFVCVIVIGYANHISWKIVNYYRDEVCIAQGFEVAARENGILYCAQTEDGIKILTPFEQATGIKPK